MPRPGHDAPGIMWLIELALGVRSEREVSMSTRDVRRRALLASISRVMARWLRCLPWPVRPYQGEFRGRIH